MRSPILERSASGWVPLAMAAIGGAIAFVLCTAAWHAADPWIRIDFNADHLLPPPILRGFYDPQLGERDEAFAWTTGAAQIRLRNVDRRVPWTVRLRVSDGARPPELEPSTLVVSADGVILGTFALVREFRDVDVRVPRQPASRRGLTLAVTSTPTFVPGRDDRRTLGIRVRRVDVFPDGRSTLPAAAVWTAGGTGAVFGIALALLDVGLMPGIMLVGGLALSHAALAAIASPEPAAYAALTLRATAMIAIAIGAIGLSWRAARHRWPSRPARLALAITIAAFEIKLAILLHPAFTVGDTGYHLHRLQRVMQGDYFFTSNAPGGEFPYPIAFYVAVDALRGWTRDWIALMRVAAAAADAGAALSVYWMVSRGWNAPWTALLALVLYHVSPAHFQVQAAAYLTNAVAHSTAVAATALVAAGPLRSRTPGWAILTTALVAFAFLTHVSTLALLLGTLGAALVLFAAAGDRDARHTTIVLAAIMAVASALAFILYYGHFADTYARLLQRAPVVAARGADESAAAAPVPIQRSEAHQTQWAPGWVPLRNRLAAVPRHTSRYLGWGTIALAATGIAALLKRRARDRLSLVILAWAGTGVGFLLLSLFTPIDVRYYLGVAPATCMLAAHAVQSAEQRGPGVRVAARALYAWSVAWGLAYWFAWFSVPLPR